MRRPGSHIYRPPTKLREGNVFTRVLSVILFTGDGGPNVSITYDALDLTIERPPSPNPSSGHRTSLYRDTACPTPASDIWWPGLKICSNWSLEESPTSPLVLTFGDD